MAPEVWAAIVGGTFLFAIACLNTWVSFRTHKQVGVNSGKSQPPTLLDMIHTIDAKIDAHLVASKEAHDSIWNAIEDSK